jgi:hypothetical protein
VSATQRAPTASENKKCPLLFHPDSLSLSAGTLAARENSSTF